MSNKNRIIKLLSRAGYEPTDTTALKLNPEPGYWEVCFNYTKDGEAVIRTDKITPETKVADLWWLV